MITAKDAAFRLNMDPDTIYFWLRTGRLKGRQAGGKHCSILVSEASVEEALVRATGVEERIGAAISPHSQAGTNTTVREKPGA